jgi:hypothetical protein
MMEGAGDWGGMYGGGSTDRQDEGHRLEQGYVSFGCFRSAADLVRPSKQRGEAPNMDTQ